jgi:hypothetical protein
MTGKKEEVAGEAPPYDGRPWVLSRVAGINERGEPTLLTTYNPTHPQHRLASEWFKTVDQIPETSPELTNASVLRAE